MKKLEDKIKKLKIKKNGIDKQIKELERLIRESIYKNKAYETYSPGYKFITPYEGRVIYQTESGKIEDKWFETIRFKDGKIKNAYKYEYSFYWGITLTECGEYYTDSCTDSKEEKIQIIGWYQIEEI